VYARTGHLRSHSIVNSITVQWYDQRIRIPASTQPATNRSIWLWQAPGLHVRVNQSSLYSPADSFLQRCVCK
jgi:hypothetical protein